MSERYQSKVFNFLSRQSLRLRDQSAQTWRQVKVAAVWGVQILLYPVYVGFQTSRLAGKQLRQTLRQTMPRLRAAQQTFQQGKSGDGAVSVDRPIRRTLKTITSLEVNLAGEQNILLLPAEANAEIERELALYSRQHPQKATVAVRSEVSGTADVAAVRIQGIASLLSTQKLVLVTTRNQILDVLSAEQQTQLTRRIVWESANHWRQQRLLGVSGQTQPILVSNYLPPPKPPKHALPPIRLFHQVMAWMQRGSVAVSADLFQESRLAALPPIHYLDLTAEPALRSAQPAWVSMEAQFYNWLGKAGQTTGALLIAGVEAGISVFTQLTATSTHSSTSSPKLPSAQPDPRGSFLPQLPAATLTNADWLSAVDRWISKLPGLKTHLLAPSNPQPRSASDDLSQLTQLPSTSNGLSNKANAHGQPTSQSVILVKWNVWLRQSLRAILPNQAALNSLPQSENWELVDTTTLEILSKSVQHQSRQRSSKLRPVGRQMDAVLTQQQMQLDLQASHTRHWDADFHIAPTSAWALEPRDVPLTSLDTANLEEAAMVPQSWIETEAQLVGYVKHPLEQLLEWIDHGMAWVENQMAKLWQWLRGNGSGTV